MPKALSAAQVEQYHRDGFLFPMRVMSGEETALFGANMDAAQASNRLRGGARTKFYLRFPWVHRLATSPHLLDVVEDLIGPDIMLYHSTVWNKEGGDGAYVSWHQDNTYFGHEPCDVLSVWVAITPATLDSGCMMFLPGTQKEGQLPLARNDINKNNLLSSGQTVKFDTSSIEPVPVVLQAGEASIHHAFLIHGSAPNVSKDRRMGMTLVYHSPGQRQVGQVRTSALLVRGEDRFGYFDHEEPPAAEAEDAASIKRFEVAAKQYAEKVRELGNMTLDRFA